MNGGGEYSATYELRRVIFFGAVASSSLIFSLAGLLFLNAQISSHPGFSTDTISEIMGYAEFLFFAYASYFAASLIVLWRAESLSRFSVSWLIVSVLGSIIFSVSFLLRVSISSLANYRAEDPFETPPPELWAIFLSVIVLSGVCSVVTSIGCGLASAIVYSDGTPTTHPR
jgi:hypothetical protein